MKSLSLPILMLTGALHLVSAETGYDLWMRYHPIKNTDYLNQCRAAFTHIVAPGDSRTLEAVRSELTRGLSGLLDTTITASDAITRVGAVVAGTPSTSPIVSQLGLGSDLTSLGEEGFLIRSVTHDGKKATVIAARSEIGVLYGAFALLRLIQTNKPVNGFDRSETPRNAIRYLDHWDNMGGNIERGYAGGSIWFGGNWDLLPDNPPPRLTDYARANASVGINGAIINNVNADYRLLEAESLDKVAALADVFRPWGVRVGISIQFNAPMKISNLATADPLDESVKAWWRERIRMIYNRIPDFIGFLVKANSEGQSGPNDYGRTHADGANLLARPLAEHDGIVMWRTFLTCGTDRAKCGLRIFAPLDGRFEDNVILQAKNGPIDFQPREPYHPLFGGMQQTKVMMEFQITQEYLGHDEDLVYLAPMWKEVLDFDTYARGKGTTVARILDGSAEGFEKTGYTGVSNVGSATNWCGHHFAQSNWYSYGRLAWNPGLTSQEIADEWIRMTFTHDHAARETITAMMMRSHQGTVDYTMPLGLNHIMEVNNHKKPCPACWGGYHGADEDGIGIDRTATGTDAVSQYYPEVRDLFDSRETCPLDYLLWFHHVPYTDQLSTGRTLIQELYHRYNSYAGYVHGLRNDWNSVRSVVDSARFAHMVGRLDEQFDRAELWHDVCVEFLEENSGIEPPPVAAGDLLSRAPTHGRLSTTLIRRQASPVLRIRSSEPTAKPLHVAVYDARGRVLIRTTKRVPPAAGGVDIPLHARAPLPHGMLFVHVTRADRCTVERLATPPASR